MEFMMSKTKPETRKEFKEYCLRRLGAPVIQINVADAQVEDLIDEALSYFGQNHMDGSIRLYVPIQVTAKVLQEKCFPIDDSFVGVIRVLETGSGSGLFSDSFQALSQVQPFTMKGEGLITYTLALSYFEMLKDITVGKSKTMRFNRHMDKLYIDLNWNNVKLGQYFVVEADRVLDPDDFEQVWNDSFLKKYATALIKKQWGNNLRKLRNVQLIGGVQIDGQSILDEAEVELDNLKNSVLLEYQEPADGFMA
jgi:hypothetical protein